MNRRSLIHFIVATLLLVSFKYNATAQCNPAIPSNANVIDTATYIGFGSSVFWICTSDTVETGGGSSIFFLESGSFLLGGGGSLIVYLENFASFNANGGGSNTIYYEPNANIIDPGGYPTLIPCPSLVYDYSNAPANSCDTSDWTSEGVESFTAAQIVNVYPNPSQSLSIIAFANPENEKFMLDLLNSNGQPVRTITDITGNSIVIDRRDLSGGLYFYQLRNERQLYAVGKLIVE